MKVSILAILLAVGFSKQVNASTPVKPTPSSKLPVECASVNIEYRGNFQLNDLMLQYDSAKRYATLLSRLPRTKDNVKNTSRIMSRLEAIMAQYHQLYIVQVECMRLNPNYNRSEATYGGESSSSGSSSSYDNSSVYDGAGYGGEGGGGGGGGM